MTDKMNRVARASNDRFDSLRFVRYISIRIAAALGGAAIAEQARGHAPKLASAMSNDGPPGGAGATRSRHQHHRATLSNLVVIDISAHVCDHGAKLALTLDILI